MHRWFCLLGVIIVSARPAGAEPEHRLAAMALFGAKGPIDVSDAPELQAVTAEVRPAILGLLAAVALLLITATANVVSLQLARAPGWRSKVDPLAALRAG
jgi:hypothetical protein